MFDFDPGKSAANAAKHGIDFVDAQALWRDDERIVIESAQRHVGEDRQLVIGRIDDRLWTAIITHRGMATRIISVRRARDYEELAYERARIR
ncbi:hypothetical protein HMP09_3319 [Sphingomonas sp. HMP9]|uniref:BrnT family toxin n=1 Tax=Sphingomonas sp. HMP9 TaxID=1517554 RepID=UPI0015964F52|nr:BrnT family toxin [Sphingomonas sp. HMP9]BCA64085.1 hypothetical protein HMP09_3319 [Sphingomonas sp. HMP9]